MMKTTNLKDQIRGDKLDPATGLLTTKPLDLAAKHEQEYQDALEREGRGPVNESPDGCYFCGSIHHHSDCCHERE